MSGELQLGLDKEEMRQVARRLDKNYSDEKYDADWATGAAATAARDARYKETGSGYLQ